MKRLEDEKIEWEVSKYKRFLGPDELKEFSINLIEKEFNEKVFKNKLNCDLHDLSECDSFNSGLETYQRLKEGMLKSLKDKFIKNSVETFDKLFNENSIANDIFKEILRESWKEVLFFKLNNYSTIMYLNQSIKKYKQ